MAKLGSLKPQVAKLGPRVAYLSTDSSQDREARNEGRAWQRTAKWQRLRWTILTRDLFTCQWPGCGKVETDTSQLVADHIIPHRGSEALFWDTNNLQCLCKPCHDRHKQRVEATGALG